MLSDPDPSDALIHLQIHCLKSLEQCFYHPTFYRIYIGSLFLEFLALSHHHDLYHQFYFKLIIDVLSKNGPPSPTRHHR